MTIDRTAPTLRPAGRPVGYQRWRSLLFLHWPVPVEMLRPLVPPALSIDVYEGNAFVGLVPFRMESVRPLWAPERVAFRFPETNVRTYVHVDGRDPGVYFFSLDAGSRIAVEIARRRWGLPYFHAWMRADQRGPIVEYRSRRLGPVPLSPRRSIPRVGPGHFSRSEPGELLGPSEPGTLEHFLIERYLLHVERGGVLWRGQVHHPPYPVQRARLLNLEDELIVAAGLPQPDGPPPLVHYAEGVDVAIFPLSLQVN